MIPSGDSFFRFFLRDTSLVSKSLNSLTPACSATDTNLLDLIYVPINLAVDFKEIAEDSVKTFINST